MSFWNGVTPQSVSEAEDGFGMFAIGENEAHIKSVFEKTSKSSGNPMLEITFSNEEGAEIKHYIVDNEYKLSNVKNLCRAFGISYDESVTPEKWIGRRGIVICKKDEFNGKVYPKVSYFKPLQPQQNSNTAPASNAQQSSQPAQQQPQQPNNNQEEDSFENDIPF